MTDISNDGQLCSRSKCCITIVTIVKWTDAFFIYISIFTAVHSDKIQDLLKYMNDIKIGAGGSVGGSNMISDSGLKCQWTHLSHWQ